jgi:enoyl-[acyl-carrier protein] reductase I
MSLRLEGRVGLVLGVSTENSVGFQCAKDLLDRGAKVCISYRQRPGTLGPELAKELGCDQVELDCTDDGSIRDAIGVVGRRWGRIDFIVHTLVHVSDGVLRQPLLELSRDQFTEVLDVSAYSLIAVVQHALPLLRLSSAARLVALLSAGADYVVPNYHIVGISKAALGACLRYIANEVGRDGVLCNGVNFSMLETTAAQHVIGEETSRRTVEYLAKHSLTRRALTVEDVTGVVAFLCSDECRNVTGEIVTVDGGYGLNYL